MVDLGEIGRSEVSVLCSRALRLTKFTGRCYYDGKSMISRLGNPFTPPQWFLDKLPKDVTLDGELFGGRREFQSTVSIVKSINHPQWKDITFQVRYYLAGIHSTFDVPFRYLTSLLWALNHSKSV